MAAAAVAEAPAPLSNGCETVQAMDRQTAAIDRLVDELKQTREAFAPAAEAIKDLGGAQKKLCAWIVSNRLKLAASAPIVLVGVGAISPNAARLIGAMLQAWGVQ